MRILLTGSRVPVTLELIRAFARTGHEVHACDSFSPTLGSASRLLSRHHVVPSPRHATEAFGRALLDIVRACRIDWLIPTCEEVFHVGRHHARLAAETRLLCSPLEELDRWHNKFSFQQHAAARGVRTPRTVLVRSVAERDAALVAVPRWLLKPAYSRFAARILTNSGPLANRVPRDSCQPSPSEPWLVQEFIDGISECSYSVVHAGRITAHAAYRTPHRVGGGAGTSFVTIPGGLTLDIARRLVADTTWTGQLSLDFLCDSDGRRWLLECNPRATSAVHVMRPAPLVRALLDPEAETFVEWPGRYQQLLFVVLMQNPMRLLANPPRVLLRDVILDPRDPLPFVAGLRQVLYFQRIARRHRISLVEATTEDIEYNGPGVA